MAIWKPHKISLRVSPMGTNHKILRSWSSSQYLPIHKLQNIGIDGIDGNSDGDVYCVGDGNSDGDSDGDGDGDGAGYGYGDGDGDGD